MAIDTYAELLDSVKNYSDTDKNPAWEEALPGFVALTEAKVRKRLRIGQQERVAQVTTVTGQYSYAPPPRAQNLRLIEYRPPPDAEGNLGSFVTLRYVAPDVMSDMKAGWSGGGPSKYTLMDEHIELLGGPETSGALRILYFEGILPLSDSNQANWLLTDYPDVYLAGCLVESFMFQRNPENIGLWSQVFLKEMQVLEIADKSDRWSGPPRSVAFNRW
jgi:hypothetical protein